MNCKPQRPVGHITTAAGGETAKAILGASQIKAL